MHEKLLLASKLLQSLHYAFCCSPMVGILQRLVKQNKKSCQILTPQAVLTHTSNYTT